MFSKQLKHSAKLMFLVASIWITMITGIQVVNATTISLTGTQQSDLSTSLNWSLQNNSSNHSYSYQLQQTDVSSGKTTTIGTKDSIKVLNITPWASSVSQYLSLKTWMETNGYGQSKISVDTVQIDAFSKNANSYLKDSSGNYKYDVIALGFADSNLSKGLSTDASTAVKTFANTGRGVLLGHDTMISWIKQNVINPDGTTSILTNSDPFPFQSELNSLLATGTSSSANHIKLIKNGYLLNYPNFVGNVGDVLTIPTSHDSGQIPIDSNDAWANFVKDASGTPLSDASTRSIFQSDGTYVAQSMTDYNQDAYLVSHNNWAMIQTGHSNGAATTDEQKLIANSLFYLGQVTSNTNFTTHTSQDVQAPDAPTLTKTYDPSSKSVTVNNLNSTDHGNKYQYQIVGTDLSDDSTIKSNVISVENTTGVSKYVYSVDSNKTGTASLSSATLTNGQQITPTADANSYLHIAAVDGNHNISTSTTYLLDTKKPSITVAGNTTDISHTNDALTISATDDGSGINSIQTPDGTWHTGSSVPLTITANGVYTIQAKDNDGNITSQTLNISNIYPEANVVNPSASDTNTETKSSDLNSTINLDGSAVSSTGTVSNWTIGNSDGTGWNLNVSAPYLTSGSHQLKNAIAIQSPGYSGGHLVSLLNSGYTSIDSDNGTSAIGVYQNKPTTFTWNHGSGLFYLRVNSYVKGVSKYNVSNIRLFEKGTTTNLLSNAAGPFTPPGTSSHSGVDNYVYFPDSTVRLVNGKTYTLAADSNGVIGSDHNNYVSTDGTDNHTVIWLASLPQTYNDSNYIVSDDYTQAGVSSTINISNQATYKISAPANAYAGTYKTNISWSLKQ